MTIETLRLKTTVEIFLAIFSMFGVAGLLFFSKPLKTSNRAEDKIFRQLIWTVLLYAILDLLRRLQKKFRIVPFDTLPAHIFLFLPDFIELLYVLLWLIFVDLSVNQSPDSIKRRYHFAVVPLVVLVVLQGIGYYFLHQLHNEIVYGGGMTVQSQNMYMNWNWFYYFVDLSIVILYMGYAWYILKFHQKESKKPIFLRLDVFIIPFVMSIISKFIPNIILQIDIPCAMLSVFLTYLSMRNRYKYMDLKTGFFKEKYLDYLIKYAVKHNYEDATVIAFGREEQPEEFIELLNKCKPDRSVVVQMEDKSLLLISDYQKESVVSFFIYVLKDEMQKKKEDFKIDIRYWLWQNEDALQDFANRVLTERMEIATAA